MGYDVQELVPLDDLILVVIHQIYPLLYGEWRLSWEVFYQHFLQLLLARVARLLEVSLVKHLIGVDLVLH